MLWNAGKDLLTSQASLFTNCRNQMHRYEGNAAGRNAVMSCKVQNGTASDGMEGTESGRRKRKRKGNARRESGKRG